MSCHLHDLAENGFSYYEEHQHHDVLKMVADALQKKLPETICFDAGNTAFFYGMKVITDLLKMPYDSMWVEYDVTFDYQETKKFGCLLLAANGSLKFGYVFDWSFKKWWYQAGWFQCDDESFMALTSNNEQNTEIINNHSHIIRVFLSALNCTNVVQVESPVKAKLQKARKKRGKLPLYSFWTLHVNLDKDSTKSQSNGGTHASPRLHLRRGHARKYAPGKYCWVRACAVGSKQNGMVHKEYAVNRIHIP